MKWSAAGLAEIFAARFRAGDPDASLPTDAAQADIDEVFFRLRSRETRRPLVVTSGGGADASAATRFAQLAVLLGAGSTRLVFHWLGPADAASTAQLTAAGVELFAADDVVRRATRLRAAWACVELGHGGGFPLGLAEAMALGLPCIAWDTPAHRALLEHGTNGLLCDSEEALLTSLAALVDSSALRTRLGQAARHDALRRLRGVATAGTSQAVVGAPASPAVASTVLPAVSTDR